MVITDQPEHGVKCNCSERSDSAILHSVMVRGPKVQVCAVLALWSIGSSQTRIRRIIPSPSVMPSPTPNFYDK